MLVHLYYVIMEDWQEWDYLEEETLTRKRRKICITCNHFRYSTTSSCATILTCPFHQKLIPQGDHLIKGDEDIGERTVGSLPQKPLEIHKTKFIPSIIKAHTNF